MKKEKKFSHCKFSTRVIRACIADESTFHQAGIEAKYYAMSVDGGGEEWTFDSVEEFFSQYEKLTTESAHLSLHWVASNSSKTVTSLSVRFRAGPFGYSDVAIEDNSRARIEQLFSHFAEARESDITRLKPADGRDNAVEVFLGHGRDIQWQKLRDHLKDKHNLEVICYESGARAGHTIRDILDDMSERATIAFLVMTGEDKTSASKLRARQNVIHECGLFQGRLGFDRGIMLVEKGIELASNFDGIQQIRFTKNRIEETFGDVLATIRREFGPI